jgi:hypothetical protein
VDGEGVAQEMEVMVAESLWCFPETFKYLVR